MAEVNANHIPAAPAAEAAPQNLETKDVQMTDADATTEQEPTDSTPAPETLLQPAAEPSSIQPGSTPTKPTPTPALAAPPQVPRQPSPIPARTATPARNEGGGGGSGSRSASAHPDPAPNKMPAEAALHGAPVRQYLNTKVTGALLEGMKKLAKERPKDPLRVLGEYLIQRSKEVEGMSSS